MRLFYRLSLYALALAPGVVIAYYVREMAVDQVVDNLERVEYVLRRLNLGFAL